MPTTRYDLGPRPTGRSVLSDGPSGIPDDPWLESQRRSRARRFDAVRRLRRLRGRRTLAAMALVSLTFAAGGAVAADRQSASVVRASGSSVSALQRALDAAGESTEGRGESRGHERLKRKAVKAGTL